MKSPEWLPATSGSETTSTSLWYDARSLKRRQSGGISHKIEMLVLKICSFFLCFHCEINLIQSTHYLPFTQYWFLFRSEKEKKKQLLLQKKNPFSSFLHFLLDLNASTHHEVCQSHLPALWMESEHVRFNKVNVFLFWRRTNWIFASRFLKPDELKVFPRFVYGPWRRRGPIKNCRCDGLFLLFLKYIGPFPLRPTPAGGMSHFLLKRQQEGMAWRDGGGGVGFDYIIAHVRGCGQIHNNIKMKRHFSVIKE